MAAWLSTSLSCVLGFASLQFGPAAYADLARFAAAAEFVGAGSRWVGDRLLTPVDPSPGSAGGDTVPDRFRSALDPSIALTVAATATKRVLLDTLERLWTTDPGTVVRINVAAETPVEPVAQPVRGPAGAGYHDAFVDLLHLLCVAAGTDEHLIWFERLLGA